MTPGRGGGSKTHGLFTPHFSSLPDKIAKPNKTQLCRISYSSSTGPDGFPTREVHQLAVTDLADILPWCRPMWDVYSTQKIGCYTGDLEELRHFEGKKPAILTHFLAFITFDPCMLEAPGLFLYRQNDLLNKRSAKRAHHLQYFGAIPWNWRNSFRAGFPNSLEGVFLFESRWNYYQSSYLDDMRLTILIL